MIIQIIYDSIVYTTIFYVIKTIYNNNDDLRMVMNYIEYILEYVYIVTIIVNIKFIIN